MGGAYFVTICTSDRSHVFGEIHNEEIQLSEIGTTAQACWHEIPKHFPSIELGAFIVMPNHVHGSIILFDDSRRGVQLNAPFKINAPTKNHFSRISPKRNSLGLIVRTYKAAVTTRCLKQGYHDFRWQRSFFDHVIRNHAAHERISNYILTNPPRWELDIENARRSGHDDFDDWLDTFKKTNPKTLGVY